MNKEKLFTRAHNYNVSPERFGLSLTCDPHNLTPAEATVLMDEYRKNWFRKGKQPAQIPPLKSNPNILTKVTVATRSGATGEVSVETAPEAAPRLSIINRSAVKAYALKVAKEKRPKFKRVSAEFLDGVQASLEAVIRGLAKSGGDDVAPDTDADWFVNGRTVRMAEEQLNIAVRAIVARRVHCQPSIGVTLK